jgi:hypothetical protein
MEGQTITNTGIRINASTFDFHIKPTLNGDETINLDVEADLELTYRLPGDTRSQHLHNSYTGAGRYPSNAPMLLASTTLKSQNSKSSRSDFELRVYVTPVLAPVLAPVIAKESVDLNDALNRAGKSVSSELVGIATLGMDQNVVARVHKILSDANIPALIGGSLGYGVRVRLFDKERALRLLKEDARSHSYWIRFAQ